MNGSRKVRRAAALLLVSLCTALGVLLPALPAAAHATVVDTVPPAGAQLTSPTSVVSLRFDESVGISRQAVRVYDAQGRQVQLGLPYHPQGESSVVAVSLRPGLAKSSYLVVWRVVSADSHPVAGTFTFGYGVPAGQVTTAPSTDRLVAGLDSALRFVSTAATMVLIGATFFVSVLWRQGLRSPRVRAVLRGAWAAGVASTVLLLGVEGVYGASLPLSGVTDLSLIGLTLGTIYGKLLLARLVALGFAAVVWLQLRRDWQPPAWLDAGGLGLVVVESYSFAGHAGQGAAVPLAATADAVHLAAASIWIGGLVLLVTVLVRPQGEPLAALDSLDLDGVLPRWSKVAASAVGLLVVTGSYQAWREVGSWDALASTSYGRLIIAKAVLLGAMLLVANYGRRWVLRRTAAHQARGRAPGLTGEPDPTPGGSAGRVEAAGTTLTLAPPGRGAPDVAVSQPVSPDVRSLFRAVTTEASLAVVVVAVTSALVTTMPARESYSPAFSTTVTAVDPNGESILVSVQIEPTRYGFESVTLQAQDASGRPVEPISANGSLTLGAQGLGPIDFSFPPFVGGRSTATSVSVPAPGEWALVVNVLTDDVTDYAARTTYLVTR